MGEYANRNLRPVEVLLLVRHREELSGRVLELGCGAGRITGYLIELADEACGLDVSSRMVQECRRRYPAGRFAEGDMSDLSRFEDGSLDAVLAGWNVLDVFGDRQRRLTLREIHRVLRAEGLLIMSSHNRAYLERVSGPAHMRRSDPLRFVFDLIHAPRRIFRHRQLRKYERRDHDYAIVSDGTHEYSLVHYYTSPAAQYRQLEQEGFTPLLCADLDGQAVAGEHDARGCAELHYVARKA